MTGQKASFLFQEEKAQLRKIRVQSDLLIRKEKKRLKILHNTYQGTVLTENQLNGNEWLEAATLKEQTMLATSGKKIPTDTVDFPFLVLFRAFIEETSVYIIQAIDTKRINWVT